MKCISHSYDADWKSGVTANFVNSDGAGYVFIPVMFSKDVSFCLWQRRASTSAEFDRAKIATEQGEEEDGEEEG